MIPNRRPVDGSSRKPVLAALGLVCAAALFAAAAPAEGAETDEVLLRLGGDEVLATTIAEPLARVYLERKGARRVWVVDLPASRARKVVGRLANGNYVSIIVETTSSSEGLRRLEKGEIDVAMTDRPAEPRELLAIGTGDDEGLSKAIARSATVVAVNPGNPVHTLTFRQLWDIYSGAITDWSEVGGAAGAITVLAPDGETETRRQFDAVVLGETPLARSARIVGSFGEMRSVLATDRNAIGYLVSSMALKRIEIVLANDVKVSPPDHGQLASGDYPLKQILRLYGRPASSNPEVSQFVRLAASLPTRVLIAFAGLSDLDPELLMAGFRYTASDRYRALVGNGLRVSTTIHFADGAPSIDNVATRELDALAAFLRRLHVRGDQLLHMAFSEDTGDPVRDQEASRTLGELVAAELRLRMVAPGEVVALGSEKPLADSGTQIGRQINRRVETWIRP